VFLPLLIKAHLPYALVDLYVQVILIFQAVDSTLQESLPLLLLSAVDFMPLPLLIFWYKVIYDHE
jgi:hypothetical protein